MLSASAETASPGGPSTLPAIQSRVTAQVELSPVPPTFVIGPTILASPPPPLPVSGEFINPITSAVLVRVHGFSPNGEVLAYWTAIDAPPIGFDDPAGQLHFLNVKTGQTCLHFKVVGYQSKLTWESDGKVVLLSAGSTERGIACTDDFTAITNSGYLNSGDADPALAPGGAYQARTSLLGITTNGVLNLKTEIINVAHDQTENVVQWTTYDGVRGPGEEMTSGGQWITNDQFLIFKTIDQGPLLVKAEGKTVRVASELFGIPDSFVSEIAARGAAVAGTQDYHLVLFGDSGLEAGFPPVRLYHSDTGEVETLPFKYTWEPTFSADGRWLFWDERPEKDGYESYSLWMRPVDPPGSRLRFLASGDALSVTWSPDWKKVAYGNSGYVSVLAFPDLTEEGLWNVGEYTAVPRAWSADGKFLAVEGYVPGIQRQALFVISIP